MIDTIHSILFGLCGATDARSRSAATSPARSATATGALWGGCWKAFCWKRQDVEPDKEPTYGRNMTDACINGAATENLLREPTEAVKERREKD